MRLVEVAEAELAKGVREVGRNRGPDVEKYQRAVALRPGDPWCAAFVSWCWMEANGLTVAPRWCSGSAVTIWHRAERRARPASTSPAFPDFKSKVQPGWIWVRAKSPAGAVEASRGVWVQGHCGIVVAVDDEGFTTIEGNTDGGGSREGDGVYRRVHKWGASDVARTVGWFDPAALAAPAVS